MAYLFNLPDGRQMAVPDELDNAQATAYAKQRVPELYPAPAPPPKPVPTSRTWGEAAKDVAAGLAGGIGGVAEGIGTLAGLSGLAGMDNTLRGVGQQIKYNWDEEKSGYLKAQEQAAQRKIDAEQGVMNKAFTFIKETATNPALAINFAAENVVNLIPGGLAGNAARLAIAKAFPAAATSAGYFGAAAVGTGAMVGTGAALHAADAASSTYDRATGTDEIPQAMWEKNEKYTDFKKAGLNDKEAKAAVALEMARTAGAEAGAIALLISAIPGASKMESIIANSVKKTAVDAVKEGTKKEIAKTGAMAALKQGAKTGAIESGTEAIEEGSAAFLQNVQLRDVNPNIDPYKGVGEAIGGGALGGGLFGSIAGASTYRRNPIEFDKKLEEMTNSLSQTMESQVGAAYTAASKLSQSAPVGTKLTVFDATGKDVEATIVGKTQDGRVLVTAQGVENDKAFVLGQELTIINPASPVFALSNGTPVAALTAENIDAVRDAQEAKVAANEEKITAGEEFFPQYYIDARDLLGIESQYQRLDAQSKAAQAETDQETAETERVASEVAAVEQTAADKVAAEKAVADAKEAAKVAAAEEKAAAKVAKQKRKDDLNELLKTPSNLLKNATTGIPNPAAPLPLDQTIADAKNAAVSELDKSKRAQGGNRAVAPAPVAELVAETKGEPSLNAADLRAKAETLYQEANRLGDEQNKLRTKTGKPPNANSKARFQYDALGVQIERAKNAWNNAHNNALSAEKQAVADDPTKSSVNIGASLFQATKAIQKESEDKKAKETKSDVAAVSDRAKSLLSRVKAIADRGAKGHQQKFAKVVNDAVDAGVFTKQDAKSFQDILKDKDADVTYIANEIATALEAKVVRLSASPADSVAPTERKVSPAPSKGSAALSAVKDRLEKRYYDTAYARVYTLVAERMKKLGLGKLVNQELLSSMSGPNGLVVSGSFNPIQKMIKLAIAGKSDNQIMALMNHESIHALRNLGMITEAEWKNLSAIVEKKGWVDRFNIPARFEGKNPSDIAETDEQGNPVTYAEVFLEEAVADAFATYVTGQSPTLGYDDNGKPITVKRADLGISGQPVGIIKRILKLVGFFRDAVQEIGAEEIFKRFETPIEPRRETPIEPKAIKSAPQTTDELTAELNSNNEKINELLAQNLTADATSEQERLTRAVVLIDRNKDILDKLLEDGETKMSAAPKAKVAGQLTLYDFSQTLFYEQTSEEKKKNYAIRLKNPVTLKDGLRLSGFTGSEQTVFYGYEKNGQLITIGREYINPDDIASSRDSNKTAERLRKGLRNLNIYQSPATRYSAAPKTQAFKRWFGDSKVVDADGNPLRVMHVVGTGVDFDVFDTKRGELGSHFGTAEQANAMMYDESVMHHTVPVYLSIKNPLRLIDNGAFDGSGLTAQLADMGILTDDEYDAAVELGGKRELTPFLQEKIKAKGYDGVVYLNRREGVGKDGVLGEDEMSDAEFRKEAPDAKDSYIAFDPEQIKSAIGNNGEYSPTNPNIRYSAAPKTQAFKRWFGNSKVVDKNGKPLRVYHGTAADFSVFNPSKRGWYGSGIYLTPNANFASEFDTEGDAPNIMPLYAKIERPYYYKEVPFFRRSDQNDPSQADMIRDVLPKEKANRLIRRLRNIDDARIGKELQGALEAMGHDGIIIETPDGQEIVAFSPTQIKSATGNNGEYSPTNPDIRYSATPKKNVSYDAANKRYVYTGAISPNLQKLVDSTAIKTDDGKPILMFHGTARDISTFKPKQAGAIFVTESPSFAESFSSSSEDRMWIHADSFLSANQIEQAKKEAIAAAKASYVNGKDAEVKAHVEDMVKQIEAAYTSYKNLPSGEALDHLLNAIEKQFDAGQNIMAVFVNAKNPFDYENEDHVRMIVDELSPGPFIEKAIREGSWEDIESLQTQRAIKAAGFDGFYVQEGGTKNLGVYESNQLKSATGNVGTFDPKDPRISYSAAPKRSVSAAPTSPAFKRWFGDSKVVDADGAPLRVYHTSKINGLTKFDRKFRTELSSMGFHFGTKEQAEFRAGQYDFQSDTPDTLELYLSIQNPLRVSHMASFAPDHLSEVMMDMGLISEEEYDALRNKTIDETEIGAELVRRLNKAGYDGLVYMNDREGQGDSYVAFEPTQIKSATGNVGTFDPKDPRISYSAAPTSQAFKRWFGNGKVVDANGKPLRVYHSSTFGDFSTFDKKAQAKGMAGYGFYFSDSDGANIYADYGANFQADRDWQGNEKKLNIMPVYLAMQKPLVADNIADVQDRFGKGDPGAFGQSRKYGGMGEAAQTAIQRAGYDGVIANEYVKKQKDGSYKVVSPTTKGALKHPVYVVFEPTQIKSATGNNGNYDPENADIRYSRAPRTKQNQWEVSTAMPTAVKPVPGESLRHPINEFLVIDTADIRAVKTHFDAVVKAVSEYNTLYGEEDPDKLLRQLHEVIVGNLTWLYDKMPSTLRERAKLWYDGANRIANEMSKKYGYAVDQVAGVMAILSPQKDWFMNVSLGERLISIFKERQAEFWSPAMTRWAESWVAASKTKEERDSRVATFKKMEKAEGRMLKDLDDLEAAYFVRVFDETYNPRQYRIVTPEGGFLDFVTNDKNEDSENEEDAPAGHVAWNGFDNIAKGVAILRGGSFENISKSLGEMHKVRNFYNNILSPGSRAGHVTIDTHAVGAALFKALSGASLEVAHNFGSTPKGLAGAGGSNATGASGTYGLFADGYRDAAARIAQRDGIDLLPRELQSITWEAIRNIFPAAWKAQNAKAINSIWDKVREGTLSREEARNQVESLSKSRNKEGKLIEPFAWENAGTGESVSDGAASFDQDIETVIVKRKARVLEPHTLRETLNVNLSSATTSIPGIDHLWRLAKNGSIAAKKLIQEIADDNIRYLLSGMGSTRISAIPATGLYDKVVEPSIGLKVVFNERDHGSALAALRKFAENFNQQQLHVREAVKQKIGTLFDDGSYVTPVYRWDLNRALSNDEIQDVIDQSGLAGLTFGEEYVEAYFVGGTSERESGYAKGISEFVNAARKVHGLLGARAGEVFEGGQRLWAYGEGFGATSGYASIHGDIPAGNGVKNETIQKVANFLMGQGRDAAIAKNAAKAEDLPKKARSFKQESELSPAQEKLQNTISRFFDLLPVNDLKNPLVKRAYKSLTKALMDQYKAIPIKAELVGVRDENGDFADMYGNQSSRMRKDIQANNHMYVYPTTPESFGGKGDNFSGHPLLEDSGAKDINGAPMLFNDVLRLVHDYYAHGMPEASFGPLGEEAAWKTHMAMTNDPLARWALTMETRAQNSWVNFRDGVDRTMPLSKRGFAQQKAALMPVEFALTGSGSVDSIMKDFIKTLTPEQRLGSRVKEKAAFNQLVQEHKNNKAQDKKAKEQGDRNSAAPKYSATRILGGQTLPKSFTTPQSSIAPSATIAGKIADLTGVKVSIASDLIFKFADRFTDLKILQRAITRSTGALSDEANAYMKEELYHYKTAKAFKDFQRKEIRPLISRMQQLGVSMDDLNTYLHSRFAEDRNVAIAAAKGAPDSGSGMSTADARANIARLSQTQKAKLDILAKMVDDITKGTRDVMVDKQLIDPQIRAQWERDFPRYVPLQRDLEGIEQSIGAGKGFSVTPRIQRALGDTRANVHSVLASVVAARESAITRGEKNEVSIALFKLALKAPNPDFWVAISPDGKVRQQDVQTLMANNGLTFQEATNIASLPQTRRRNPTTGFIELVTVNLAVSNSLKKMTVSAMINGKEHIVVFNDRNPVSRRLAETMNNDNLDKLGMVLKFTGAFTRYFSMMATQLNPIFGVVNLLRDIQSGLLNLSSTPLAGKEKIIFNTTFPAIAGVFSQIRAERDGTSSTNPWGPWFERFEKAGGPTGFRDTYANLGKRHDALVDEFSRLNQGNFKRGFTATLNMLSDYNSAMENGIRLAAFKEAVGTGMSDAQAASLAKNLTVNFNRKGASSSQYGALYAFFNASTQGTARIIETLRGPMGKKIVAGGMMVGVAQALMFAIAGYDDDQPPQFVREKAFVIPIPGSNGKYLAIPYPLGFNILPNIGRVVTTVALNGGKNVGKSLADLISSSLSGLNPLGDSPTLLHMGLPTIADPIASLGLNKDSFGRRIYRDSGSSLREKPRYLTSKEGANPASVWVAKALNSMSGGKEAIPGKINISGDEIDYVIGQAFGGIGKEITKGASSLSSTVTGADLPTYKIPLFGRFIGDTREKASVSTKYYETIRELNGHAAQIAYIRTHPGSGNVADYIKDQPEARFANSARAVSSNIDALNSQKRKALDKGAPRERIQQIEKNAQAQMERFNETFKRNMERSKNPPPVSG